MLLQFKIESFSSLHTALNKVNKQHLCFTSLTILDVNFPMIMMGNEQEISRQTKPMVLKVIYGPVLSFGCES